MDRFTARSLRIRLRNPLPTVYALCDPIALVARLALVARPSIDYPLASLELNSEQTFPYVIASSCPPRDARNSLFPTLFLESCFSRRRLLSTARLSLSPSCSLCSILGVTLRDHRSISRYNLPRRQMSPTVYTDTTCLPWHKATNRVAAFAEKAKPLYADLPVHYDIRTAWEYFGRDDELGTINFLTGSVVAAAAREIKDGTVVSLNLPIQLPTHPSYHRMAAQAEVTSE